MGKTFRANGLEEALKAQEFEVRRARSWKKRNAPGTLEAQHAQRTEIRVTRRVMLDRIAQ